MARVLAAWRRGEGGRIVTPNIDILRIVSRCEEARRLVVSSSLILADGMPVVWASRLAGDPLPCRVAGSDLLWALCAAAAAEGRSVYLLGGAGGVPDRAASVLRGRYPDLQIAGTHSPPFGFDASVEGVQAVVAEVREKKPDLVFVGLGFPRQERLIDVLVPELPTTWFVGCGASIDFAAGRLRRAPVWMRRLGLEWTHRLACEPRRLFRRYLINDLPFAIRLLTTSALSRFGRAPQLL